MNVATLITRIKAHGFEYLADADILLAINDAYHDFCGLERWPFLQKQTTLAFAANATWTNVPSPASGTTTSVRRVFDTTNKNLLRWYSAQDAINVLGYNEVDVTVTGIPTTYFVENDPLQIYLYPIPTVTTNLTMYVDIHPIELLVADAESAILIPPRYHIVLMWAALRNLSIQADDTDNMQIFDALYDKQTAKARDDLIHSQSDRSPIMIDVYSDEYYSDYDG